MMGPSHALSGAAGWFVVLPLVQRLAPEPLDTAQVFVGAAVCAGFALWPDVDEEQSTLARSFGPLTLGLATLVNKLSSAWYNLTKTSREPTRVDGHRLLTHSLPGMLLTTAGVAALAGWGGKAATIGILFFMLGLAIRGLMGDWAKRNGWLATTAAAAASAFTAYTFLPQGDYWWLFAAALVGQLFHGVGDGITKEGVPWLGGVVTIRGKRWWEFTLPSFLRIRAGGWVENAVLNPVFGIVLVLGVWSTFAGWPVVVDSLRRVVGL